MNKHHNNHDTNARLAMLRDLIDRNRDRVSEQHEFEGNETAQRTTTESR